MSKAMSDEIVALGREIDQIAAAVARNAHTSLHRNDVSRQATGATDRVQLAIGSPGKTA